MIAANACQLSRIYRYLSVSIVFAWIIFEILPNTNIYVIIIYWISRDASTIYPILAYVTDINPKLKVSKF